ncbi:hypothetical protein DFH27DRAFT_569559 [Peziza echinospora]|nr:hypothetical protein DFH27DRAFT_569559 [Peziza echinospora]
MKLLSLVPFAAYAAAAALPVAIESVSAVEPPSVTIGAVSYGGTGCPQSTLTYKYTSPFRTLALFYPQLDVAVGPDAAITESRRNCQVTITLHYTKGYQYAVDSLLTGGHVKLDAGVTGLQKVSTYFSGEPENASSETIWTGPVNKDYLITNDISEADVIWSKCDGGVSEMLNINLQARLDDNGGNGKGTIVTDFGAISLGLGIRWKEC